MAKTSYEKAIEAKDFSELEASGISVDELQKALRAKETQRLAHKKNYLRRQALMTRIKEEHPELIEEANRMIQ